ncbi:MAG: hypothetical protein ACYSTX_02010, partial [Planctomycetota bacterium]
MPVVETDFQSQIVQLISKALNGFCEDISGMFDINMECTGEKEHTITVQDIEEHFKTLTAINIISVTGTLTGDFFLVFDRKGLFTLPGIISMLSEKEILENIEQGSEKE